MADMTSAADYRTQLATLAEDAGFAEGDPLRAGLMLLIACEWLEAKDRHLQGLGDESQNNVTPIHREAHSHATKGRR